MHTHTDINTYASNLLHTCFPMYGLRPSPDTAVIFYSWLLQSENYTAFWLPFSASFCLFSGVLTEALASAVTVWFTIPLSWLCLFLCGALLFPAMCFNSICHCSHKTWWRRSWPLCVCLLLVSNIPYKYDAWGKTNRFYPLKGFFRMLEYGFKL